jgi:hypothetical protein
MKAGIVSLCVALSLLAGCATMPAMVWKLDHVGMIGSFKPEVLGSPRVAEKEGRRAVCFDGKADGLIFPLNPIGAPVGGDPAFTIEILLRPDGDGPAEQRFLHIQDEREHRVLMETRVSDRAWSLDTFLRTSDADKLTLLDRTQTQPTDRWYWAALVYDGKTMSHYVNGTKQLEGEVAFVPTVEGTISLGVRLNRVYWYKGCIAEVRFASIAIPAARLRRP